MKTREVRRHSVTKKSRARDRGSLLVDRGVCAARSLGEALPDFGYVLTDYHPSDNHRVLIDPEGHPFCLCR